jgi:hypothetical protein
MHAVLQNVKLIRKRLVIKERRSASTMHVTCVFMRAMQLLSDNSELPINTLQMVGSESDVVLICLNLILVVIDVNGR